MGVCMARRSRQQLRATGRSSLKASSQGMMTQFKFISPSHTVRNMMESDKDECTILTLDKTCAIGHPRMGKRHRDDWGTNSVKFDTVTQQPGVPEEVQVSLDFGRFEKYWMND